MEIVENTDYKYIRAQNKAEEIAQFYKKLTTFIVIMPILIVINYRTGWWHQWFWFPLAGWGFGLLKHAAQVFDFNKRWKEKKIKELMEKDNL